MKNYLIDLVKDLEDTRDDFKGYSYVRTMRNILVGKDNALIAPFFVKKPYYGIYDKLSLSQLEQIMDNLVKARLLEVIFTNNGKLYCTPSYQNKNIYRHCS